MARWLVHWCIASLIAKSFSFLPALAQSITPAPDGTGTAIAISGQTYIISGGTQAGANLFHSFQQFGLTPGEIAHFLTQPHTRNLLARVVGGNPTVIEGLIRLSGSGANLFLVNPAGWVFGSGARLDVPASFHVTTADRVLLDTGMFNATGGNDWATLAGNVVGWQFDQATTGFIVNQAPLTAPGAIAFLAPVVINTGHLTSSGPITLAAIPEPGIVRLSQPGSLLSLEINLNPGDLNSLTPLAIPQHLTGPLPPQFATRPGSLGVGGALIAGSQAQLLGASVDVDRATVRLGGNLTITGGEVRITHSDVRSKGAIALFGQGHTGSIGNPGGTGILLEHSHLETTQETMTLTGIGGQGGAGFDQPDGATGGKNELGGAAGLAGGKGGAGGMGILLRASRLQTLSGNVILTGTGGQGGQGGAGGGGGGGGSNRVSAILTGGLGGVAGGIGGNGVGGTALNPGGGGAGGILGGGHGQGGRNIGDTGRGGGGGGGGGLGGVGGSGSDGANTPQLGQIGGIGGSGGGGAGTATTGGGGGGSLGFGGGGGGFNLSTKGGDGGNGAGDGGNGGTANGNGGDGGTGTGLGGSGNGGGLDGEAGSSNGMGGEGRFNNPEPNAQNSGGGGGAGGAGGDGGAGGVGIFLESGSIATRSGFVTFHSKGGQGGAGGNGGGGGGGGRGVGSGGGGSGGRGGRGGAGGQGLVLSTAFEILRLPDVMPEPALNLLPFATDFSLNAHKLATYLCELVDQPRQSTENFDLRGTTFTPLFEKLLCDPHD